MTAQPTVVLVHGLAIARSAAKTFHGVEQHLTDHGHRTARTLVQGDGTIEELADRLWAQLAALDGDLVLLCHSMGGLQARTFLLDETRARRIRAIATIGSSHAGTPFARVMAPVQKAYRPMTPEGRAAWNTRFADEEQRTAARLGIRCISAVARIERRARHLQLEMSRRILERHDGPNDGLVSARSQRWGELAFEIDRDHIECAAIAGTPQEHEVWLRLAEVATRPA